MLPESLKLLEDIRDAAACVLQRTENETLSSFRQNRDLRQAVERNFEVIGEAVRWFNRHDPLTAERITDFQQIISFRHVIIHTYDVIDPARVWAAIQSSLPTHLDEVETMQTDEIER